MNQRDNVNQGEVRRAPRKSVSRAVVVAYGEKRATVGETFVNISSSGARIRTLARQELLDGFFLIDLAEKAAYLCAGSRTKDLNTQALSNRYGRAACGAFRPSIEWLIWVTTCSESYGLVLSSSFSKKTGSGTAHANNANAESMSIIRHQSVGDDEGKGLCDVFVAHATHIVIPRDA